MSVQMLRNIIWTRFFMSVQMLRNIIWTRFFTKPVCQQNLVVIFEKSYLLHMKSFLAEIWCFYRTLSQESNQIEFASIGLLQLPIFKLEWPKVNTSKLRDLTLKAAISMLFFILFSCLRFTERYGCQLFNATRTTKTSKISFYLSSFFDLEELRGKGGIVLKLKFIE